LGTTSFAASGRSSGNLIIYKEHHEASTIELFYDLYFVANLGNFS
jgi:low temperature requirement protein LtrA